MSQCQELLAQVVRLSLVFTYIWQEDIAKIPQVPEAPDNIMVARLTIYYTIFQ